MLIIHKYITVECTRPGYDRNASSSNVTFLHFHPFALFLSLFSLFSFFFFFFLHFRTKPGAACITTVFQYLLRGVDRGGFNDNYCFGTRKTNREERATGADWFRVEDAKIALAHTWKTRCSLSLLLFSFELHGKQRGYDKVPPSSSLLVFVDLSTMNRKMI